MSKLSDLRKAIERGRGRATPKHVPNVQAAHPPAPRPVSRTPEEESVARTEREVAIRGGVSVTLPGIRVYSESNEHTHWRIRAKRAKDQQFIVTVVLGPTVARYMMMVAPLTVTMTRVAPSKGLDSDNLVGSMKHVRDGIAKVLGIDDSDPRVLWVVEQRKGAWTIEIRIEATNGHQTEG